jgi:hypothetical protein
MYYLIIILVIVLFILFLKYQTNQSNKKTESFINNSYYNQMVQISKKPFIWIYIEETYNSRDWKNFYSRLVKGNTPSYIWLCLYSVYLNCFKDFNIILLNPKNIYEYLPELNIKMDSDSTIELSKRKQYISFCLLEKYGGIYLESNVIVMKNLIDVYNKIVDFDFIGFPCALEYYKCYGNEIKPSTDVMISRKNNILMKLCKQELYKMVHSYNYTSYNFNHYGNCVLLKYLEDSINKFGMRYLQLSTEYNGVSDYNNKIITSENLLSKNETIFLSESNVYLFVINKEEITKNFKYNWFDRFSIDQIIASNLWINKLFSKSFKFDNKYYYLPIFEDCNYESKNCNCDISFGRFNCKSSNTLSLNEYDKIKEYDLPPKNKINLINMLQNCNYFSTPPWLTVYNSSTQNN